MKTWTYNQITKHTEDQIKRIMRDAKAEEADSRMQTLLWAQAVGIYASWSCLTIGWQSDGDGERLEALTKLPINAEPNKEKS